jgi:hypothetical protein
MTKTGGGNKCFVLAPASTLVRTGYLISRSGAAIPSV